jgi:hypothetical protein
MPSDFTVCDSRDAHRESALVERQFSGTTQRRYRALLMSGRRNFKRSEAKSAFVEKGAEHRADDFDNLATRSCPRIDGGSEYLGKRVVPRRW